MNFFKTKILALLMVALFSFNAHSAIINLTPDDCNDGVNCWTSLDNNNPDAAAISSLIGTTISDLLYKDDQGGSEEGPFADFYSTEYFNIPTDPEDATVSWDGGDSISCGGIGTSSCYLSILDGMHDPALYVFDISDWDGLMDIELEDFWPDMGAISNLAIWGADGSGPCEVDCGGGGQEIPEPGMLFLFTSGLFGLAWSRRKITH